MAQHPLTAQDEQLVSAAEHIIKDLFQLGRHQVGAALRTKSGDVFTAVHVEANIGRVTVCAEAMVIGKAISEGHKEFDTIVAVRHPDPDQENQDIRVVSPCGMCRELISDYGETMKVILKDEDGLIKCDILDLLPLKYKRT